MALWQDTEKTQELKEGLTCMMSTTYTFNMPASAYSLLLHIS